MSTSTDPAGEPVASTKARNRKAFILAVEAGLIAGNGEVLVKDIVAALPSHHPSVPRFMKQAERCGYIVDQDRKVIIGKASA